MIRNIECLKYKAHTAENFKSLRILKAMYRHSLIMRPYKKITLEENLNKHTGCDRYSVTLGKMPVSTPVIVVPNPEKYH